MGKPEGEPIPLFPDKQGGIKPRPRSVHESIMIDLELLQKLGRRFDESSRFEADRDIVDQFMKTADRIRRKL